jgi:hypothetical protein
VDNARVKEVMDVVGANLRGKEVVVKMLWERGKEVDTKGFWERMVGMLEKVKGVKSLEIILEARIAFQREDVRKVYQALMDGRRSLERFMVKVNQATYAEF